MADDRIELTDRELLEGMQTNLGHLEQMCRYNLETVRRLLAGEDLDECDETILYALGWRTNDLGRQLDRAVDQLKQRADARRNAPAKTEREPGELPLGRAA